MPFSTRLSLSVFALVIFCGVSSADESQPLPFPKNFDSAKYLGKWYEIARLPTPVQPANTLATAEYSKSDIEGEIVVKNSAFDAKGKAISSIMGKAKLAEGEPPRLSVSFGPIIPSKPNYHVLHVDKRYQVAVVGNPDRKSLWILARNPAISKQKLQSLIDITKQAGFDTEKLQISNWRSAQPTKFLAKRLIGTWQYRSAEKNGQMLDEAHFSDQEVVITNKTITLKSKEFTFVLKYELIEDTKPQVVKLTITKSPFGTGQTSTGILELKQGTLKLCYPPMGGEQPTQFSGKAGSDQHYFVLKRKPQKLSVEKMVGTWNYESGEISGRKLDKAYFEGSHVEITKDAITLHGEDNKFVLNYQLDPTKQPATLDLKITAGPFGEGATSQGIAQMKNGLLYICYHPQGGTRPTKFEAGAESEHTQFVLRRVPK